MLWSAIKEIENISEQQLEIKEIYESETGLPFGGDPAYFEELKPGKKPVKKAVKK